MSHNDIPFGGDLNRKTAPPAERATVRQPAVAESVVAETPVAVGVPLASRLGTVLGKWRLLSVIGEGEFGTVYAAEHTLISELRAAVKVLHPHRSLDSSIVQRFLNEAIAANTAQHDNIIRVFDGDMSSGGTCYLAMELLAGATLRERLAQGPLEIPEAIRIGVQIAAALEAAHRRHIVHRDLKPDNVFLVERFGSLPIIKLFDFGIARLRDVAGDMASPRTRTGVLMGTPAYMSPEQWMSLPDVDERADIYALGVVLFECLTGAPPFRGDLYTCVRGHMELRAAPLPDLGPGSPALGALIQSMLVKDRDGRPASMGEVIETLEAIHAGPASVPAQPPDARRHHRGRRRTMAVMGLLGLFGLAATLGTIRISLRGANRTPAAPQPALAGNETADAGASTKPPDGLVELPRAADSVPPSHTPGSAQELRYRLSIFGCNVHQSALIRTCLPSLHARPPYEIKLRRSGALHVVAGPSSSAFGDCLRDAFQGETPPIDAVIRRVAVGAKP